MKRPSPPGPTHIEGPHGGALWQSTAVTVVERDPQRRELTQRALEALRSGKLEWRHHGIGVLQAYLEEGEGVEHRLHIWSRSLLKPGIDASGDVHDHRFDMVSHVLFGKIVNEEWHLTADPEGTLTTMTLVNARAAGAAHNFHAPMQPTHERYVCEPRFAWVPAGFLYRFPKKHFHRSPHDRFAITWVEKHNQVNEPARIVHPIDIPAVAAFGHEPDRVHIEALEDLAIESLEGILR